MLSSKIRFSRCSIQSMDRPGGDRTPIRIQSFSKKLHPDVLRARLRNVRKFLVTVFATNRGNSAKEGGTAPGTVPAILASSSVGEECNTSLQVTLREDNVVSGDNGKEIITDTLIINSGRDDQKHHPNDSTNETKMDASVSNLMAHQEKEGGRSAEASPSLVIDVDTRDKSPVMVQEWVDSLPLTAKFNSREECESSVTILGPAVNMESDILTLGAEASHLCSRKSSIAAPINVTISCHVPSEAESHCSSVDSLLEARKPDPEEILLGLGFGGSASSGYLETGRVPKRFLSPSQLKGVDLDDFLRQQQDLIYTFESGCYGYRGLAGPSHTNPSEIVAKILEKLREHEKETTSMTSYLPDFRKRCFVDQNAMENQPKKFSKVARSVLTTIRCTPSSVLSPDNRRWLDSQGDKSPEVARRLILGQQSFTFGRDGDLIESFDDVINGDGQINLDSNSNCNWQDVNGNNGENVEANSERFNQNKVADDKIEDPNHLPIRSSVDLHLQNMIRAKENDIRKETENQTLIEDDLNNNSPSNLHPSDSSSFPPLEYGENIASAKNSDLSLHDELNNAMKAPQDPVKRKKVLTRYKRFEESVSENSEDEYWSRMKLSKTTPTHSERLEERSNSATESELETQMNEMIEKQYGELILLESTLEQFGRPVHTISKKEFYSSSKQRSTIMSKIIHVALEIYENQLAIDDISDEWRTCLAKKAHEVSSLLDNVEDTSKLSTVMGQVTLLIQRQSQLTAQIRGLSLSSSYHDVYDHMFKRVHELELLVKKNGT